MSAEALYSPCIAAHSPLKLLHISANKIASLILSFCLPDEFKTISYSWDNLSFENHSIFDKIILNTLSIEDHIRRQIDIKDRLYKAQLWWNTTNWFGSHCSSIKRIVQDGMARMIDPFDAYFTCPLLKFTLQILFTREAGVFTHSVNKIRLELPKPNCQQFLDFLVGFDNFHVESLKNDRIIFGSPQVLVHIIATAPYLKRVHLRYNTSDYILLKLTMLKNLEVLICEDFLGSCPVSTEYFYKCFFSGMSKNEIVENYKKGIDVKTSFPHLKYVDIGKSAAIEEFLGILQFFYRNLRSLSCRSVNFTATYINSLPRSPFNESVTYTIYDIGLTADCILNLDRKKTLTLMPSIKHVTIYIDQIPDSQIEAFREKTKEYLAYLRYFSLTLCLSFDRISDQKIEEIFLPIFHLYGTNITALQFDLKILSRLETYWLLANACFNLNLLGLAISESSSFRPSTVQLNHMSTLKSLSINLVGVLDSEVPIVEQILNQVLVAAPNLQSIELILPTNLADWIMTVAAKGLLKNVQTLILKLCPYTFMPDVDFYVPVVEAMTKLRSLVLINVPGIIVSHMRSIFQNSELKVSYSRKRIISYHGLGYV